MNIFAKVALGCFLLAFLIFFIDWALVHLKEWHKRRKREAAARKWGMVPGAFKGVQRNWWEA